MRPFGEDKNKIKNKNDFFSDEVILRRSWRGQQEGQVGLNTSVRHNLEHMAN